MKELGELVGEAVEKLTLQLRAELQADREAFAFLVAVLDKAGPIDGRGLAAILKEKSQPANRDWRGDPNTLFVIGQMIEDLLEIPPGPANTNRKGLN